MRIRDRMYDPVDMIDLAAAMQGSNIMEESSVDRLASLLIEARRSGRKLPNWSGNARPNSLEDGMRVQDEVERRLGLDIGGWKVGNPPGASTYRGPIFSPDILVSPAVYFISEDDGASDHYTTVAEGEFAFKIGHDLPDRGCIYSEGEVLDAVASACVAIEILQWRLPDITTVTIGERVADNLGNAGLVVGHPSATWHSLDRKKIRSRMHINGKTIAEKTGGREGPADPVSLLVWLVNHLTGRGGLRAGQIVTTGAWIGPHVVKPGDVMTVFLDGLGEAQVRFTKDSAATK